MKNIGVLLSENFSVFGDEIFQFLEMKCSIYLNRRVFVMEQDVKIKNDIEADHFCCNCRIVVNPYMTVQFASIVVTAAHFTFLFSFCKFKCLALHQEIHHENIPI